MSYLQHPTHPYSWPIERQKRHGNFTKRDYDNGFDSNKLIGIRLIDNYERLPRFRLPRLTDLEKQHHLDLGDLQTRVIRMALSSDFLPNFRSKVFSVQSTSSAWGKAYHNNPRDFTAEIIRYAEEMFTTTERSLKLIDTTLNELETFCDGDQCIFQYIELPTAVMSTIWDERLRRTGLNDRFKKDMNLFNEALDCLSCTLSLQLEIKRNDIRQNLRGLAYITLAAPINKRLATPFQKLETGAHWRGLQEAVTGNSVTGQSGRMYQKWLGPIWDESVKLYKAGQIISDHPLQSIFEKYKTNSQRRRIRDKAMRIRNPISNDAIHSYVPPDGNFIILPEQWTEEQYDVMVATFQLLQHCHSTEAQKVV